jgi:hypothetical protein
LANQEPQRFSKRKVILLQELQRGEMVVEQDDRNENKKRKFVK